VISVTPYHVTFDGSAHTATGSATGVNSEALSGLVLTGTTHTNAGTYVDSWSFSNANYGDQSATVTDRIDKAGSSVSVSCPVSVTYTGDAIEPCTASYSGAGGLSGSLTPSYSNNVNAGTALASAIYGGDANHDGSNNSATFLIDQAQAQITVTPYSVTYDGNPHTATVTATGVENEDLSGSVDLSGTTHTNAGDYPNDPWSFANPNYASQASTVHDVIDKADASINVTPYSVTYDGAAHTATGSATGVESTTPANLSSLLHLGGTTHTDAGDYPSNA
jgi:hypothetical protein